MTVLAQTTAGQRAPFVGPPIDWYGMSPIIVLLAGALVLMVAAALTPRWPRGLYALGTVATAGASAVLFGFQWHRVDEEGPLGLVGRALNLDHFGLFVAITICIAAALAALLLDDYLRREELDGIELYALLLCSALGGVVMAMANDLIVLFLGIEILSIALYVLAAGHARRLDSQESALKYFVLGGFASAFLLYGIALVYGATGSTNLADVRAFLRAVTLLDSGLLLAGFGLLLVGLGFKIAAAPFHVWTPDVYQGAPSPVTGFMASAAKAAAFAGLLRVFTQGFVDYQKDWKPAIFVIAVATLAISSILAAVQTNVKRMLAYSSINHAGFILVGVEAVSDRGTAGSLLYLLAYAVLVLGTFAVVGLVGRTGDSDHSLARYRGLGRERPALALAFTVLLLAQAGVPLTSGFVAKFGVITAAVDARSYAIAIVAMLAAVISAYLYLRIMVSMWLADPVAGDDARERVRIPLSAGLVVVLAVGFTLVVGIAPGWAIDWARNAVPVLAAN